MTWTPDRIDAIKALWSEGQSANFIACQIGDTSRNAVLGKLYRLGLLGDGTARRKPEAQRPTSRRRIAGRIKLRAYGARLLPVEPPKPAQALMVPLLELTSTQCRWPIGDPKTAGFGFCGCKRVPGSPYCAHHTYVAQSPRARRASR